ncbi:SDR family oxidoreductase [Roseovarius spongiae]|nr:SDR family oxidoreductase [Roseovarius spongiae]
MTGKTVLITGASRGIGAAAARVFADAGASLLLVARSEALLGELAAELGPRTRALACDVARFDHMQRAVDTALEAFGRLDVLINNAGVIEPIAPLAESDPDGWARAIDINLTGVYNGMRAAIPVMQQAGGGTILNVSSGAAHNPLEGWSHYCASKAGAAMLTKCAHHECAAGGLRVMGLSPGTVATQMQHEIKSSGVNPVSALDWSDHVPPEWPARALLWMCSTDADDLAGTEISLRDAGIRARIGLA